ncbi:MAG: hypothetical protein ACRDD1_05435 [Planctomycetia bacterium]
MDRRTFFTAGATVGGVLAGTDASADAGGEPAPIPEVELLLLLVRQQYGGRLTETQLSRIRQELAGDLASSRRLRAVKLTNGDEPLLHPSAVYRNLPDPRDDR